MLSLPASAPARSMLAYLILSHGRAISRTRLAGLFWPERPEAQARRACSQALWQIRGSLEEIATRLEADGESVAFHLHASDWLDVAEFEQLCAAGKRGGLGQRRAALQAAVALYSGDLLLDLYDDWCLVERERLRECYLQALEPLLTLYKQQRDYTSALTTAQTLIAADPLHEAAHQEVMRLYYLLDRPRAALAQFAQLRELLAEELDAEPMPSSVALYREITAALEKQDIPHLPIDVPPPLLGSLAHLPFVGRREERAQLVQALKSAARGHGGVAIVHGAAGVGKSRLVREVIADAEWHGFQVGLAKVSVAGGVPPYQLLREALSALLTPLRISELAALVEPVWLSALIPLLPALREQLPDLPTLPPLDLHAEWQRLWEALARCLRALASIAPLLLVFEDVHWADNASLAALPHLAANLTDAPLLLLLTSRTVEAQERPLVLETLEAAGQNAPLTRISLKPFAPEEVQLLLQRALDVGARDAAARAFAARLGTATGGNALHLLESLKLLVEQGTLAPQEEGEWRYPAETAPLDTPISVKELVAERVARLPAAARGVLELVSVFGDAADFPVLAAAHEGEATELARHLEHLQQRGFLRPTGRGYRFEHDQVQEIIYGTVAPARQLRLHRCAGQAMEALRPQQVETLAYHFTQGEQWEKAVTYNRQAGDGARAIYANDAAAAYYTQALTALEQLSGAPDLKLRFTLHLAREAVYALQGEAEAQTKELETLARLAEQMGDPRSQATVALRRAGYAEATGDYSSVIMATQATIELAQAIQAVELEAEGHLKWGLGLWHQGEYEAARRQLERALTLAQNARLQRVAADSLHNLGNVFLYQDRYPEASDHFEQARTLYHELGDRRGEGNALHNIGFVAHALGDRGRAQNYYLRSLDIYREIGFRRGEATALSNFSVTLVDQGNYPHAREYFEQALHIYRQIGDRQNQAVALSNIGSTWENIGYYTDARSYYEQALGIYREVGDQRGEATSLSNLSLNAHYQGDNETARTYAQEAVDLMQELGIRYSEGFALTYLGHALAGLGQWEAAAETYHQAVALRRELGDPNLVMESLAGLAHVALAQGDRDAALSHVEEIVSHLESETLDGTDEPLRIYLTCYRVLRTTQAPRAREVLAAAYRLLQERAAMIEDAGLQRAFLENVAAHRETAAAYRELQGQRQTVRLPHVDAPTGRPLRDDEYIAVTWTPHAPEDDAIRGKVARRRAQLRRLVQQAGDQRAAPTVEDLAAALEVSASTLKRDLAALRQAGHDIKTRGSNA